MNQMLLCHCVSAYQALKVAHEVLSWPFLLGDVEMSPGSHTCCFAKGCSATHGFVFLQTATEEESFKWLFSKRIWRTHRSVFS